MLKENNIVPSDFVFDEVYNFKKDNITNLAFALNNKSINLGKLAMFRLQLRDDFGAMWLSDYVDNYLKDINVGFEKVKAPIIGADGNVFNLIGICSRALKEKGYREQAKELQERVTSSKSYDEALQVMMEYVEPTDQYGNGFEDCDLDNDIYI